MKNFILAAMVFAASANAQEKVQYPDARYKMQDLRTVSLEQSEILSAEINRPENKLTGILSHDLFSVSLIVCRTKIRSKCWRRGLLSRRVSFRF